MGRRADRRWWRIGRERRKTRQRAPRGWWLRWMLRIRPTRRLFVHGMPFPRAGPPAGGTATRAARFPGATSIAWGGCGSLHRQRETEHGSRQVWEGRAIRRERADQRPRLRRQRRFGPDAPTVCFDEAARNRQSQPGPTRDAASRARDPRARRLGAIGALEDVRQIIGGDALARVDDPHDDLTAALGASVRAGMEQNGATGGRGAEGGSQQGGAHARSFARVHAGGPAWLLHMAPQEHPPAARA